MTAFSILLRRHMDDGTRPPGEKKKSWKVKELAFSCDVSLSTVNNWREGNNPPSTVAMGRIAVVLFGADARKDAPVYAAWREELWQAYRATKEPRGGKVEALKPADDSKIEPAVFAEQRFSHLLVRVPPNFLGRESALVEIGSHLARYGKHVKTVILTGMRGVGKSTLVAAYANASKEHYSRVWSIDAETTLSAKSGLVELGKRMRWLPFAGDSDQDARTVLDHIAQEGRDFLLIYDNALSAQSVSPLLPRSGECHVLITSNATDWRSIGIPLEIKEWPANVGTEFLCKRTGQHSQGPAARELSIALDGLPLAHEMAAAYCENLDVSLADYLATFNAHPIRLLSDRRYSPMEYYGGIAVSKAFEMAIEAAKQTHPASAVVITYASLLPAEPVPLCIFTLGAACFTDLEGRPFTEEDIAQAIGALQKLALITDVSGRFSDESHEDKKRQTAWMQIHRLMRIVAVDYGRRTGIILESPEDKLVETTREILSKCGYFEPHPSESGTSIFNLLINYCHRLEQDLEFKSKLSDGSRAYLRQEYAGFTTTFEAWPH